MAAVRGKTQVQIGSAQWIQNERSQIAQFEEQEIEDFAFSTRNEVEWLNEHMAEIFSSTQLNVTEVFKTPGKLRGKTPRTTRKRNALENRAPLSEIFSADKRFNSPMRLPADLDDQKIQPLFEEALAVNRDQPVPRKATKQNTDSGYHGMTEDEMEVDEGPLKSGPEVLDRLPEPMQVDLPQETVQDEEHRTTEGSFHSARENLTTREVRDVQEPEATDGTKMDNSFHAEATLPDPLPSEPQNTTTTTHAQDDQESVLGDENQVSDAEHSSSQGSSPVKPLLRKSSLTFASLPAREPLTTKKSIGHQATRASIVDTAKNTALNRGSYLERFTGGKSLGAMHQTDIDVMDGDEDERPALAREESDADGKLAMLHNKSSTQRLQERINQLGKIQPARPTKSITSAVAPPQPVYPELPNNSSQASPPNKDVSYAEASKQPVSMAMEDDDDDWIMPPAARSEQKNRPQLLKSRSVDVMEQVSGKESVSGHDFGMGPKEIDAAKQRSPLRNLVSAEQAAAGKALYKSISTTALSSTEPLELGHQKAISVSNPTFPSTSTTTPPGSPASKLHLDGHLSASKSKLQSIMKSARGLFSSSAKISSQAKMETMSPSTMKLRNHVQESVLGDIMESVGRGQPTYPTLPGSHHHQALESPAKGRKTRSSTEKEEKRKEKEAIERQRAEGELEKARERERQKAAKHNEQMKATNISKALANSVIGSSTLEQTSRPVRQSPRRLQNRDEKATPANELKSSQLMGPPPSRPQVHASGIQKPKETRRPIKPTKETIPKPKPQPVSIRVGTLGGLSQKIALANASVANHQDHPAPTQAKQTMPTKKASTASQHSTTSTASFKTSISSNTSKPKSLVAAERKREQDEREAQRKLEQKKEIERKRAAAQEEAHRRELQQRQEAEKERERERSAAAEEAKRLAQKQAFDKRRLELSKKEQQQRDPQRVANDLAQALNNERSQVVPSHRPELGATKPLSRMDKIQDFPRPPTNHIAPNPAKPKRVFDPDQDDELAGPVRTQPGQNYQQNDAKRRRTEDEETFDPPMRLAMAPPMRYSNMRKEAPKTSIFGSNYPTAPPPASSHAGSSKTTMMSQPYQQQAFSNQAARAAHPMDMAKYTNGKIPFAEAPNPPQATYKTPLPSKQTMQPPSKSSPMFPNGDNIHLEDIQTSEEEDSDDERDKKSSLPEWVRTPVMNDILRRQETMNPDAVFGPIPPANVEEWFTKDKNRLHKLRARTSSANWFPDRVTEEEIRNDVAAREKMSKEGGWSFGL